MSSPYGSGSDYHYDDADEDLHYDYTYRSFHLDRISGSVHFEQVREQVRESGYDTEHNDSDWQTGTLFIANMSARSEVFAFLVRS